MGCSTSHGPIGLALPRLREWPPRPSHRRHLSRRLQVRRSRCLRVRRPRRRPRKHRCKRLCQRLCQRRRLCRTCPLDSLHPLSRVARASGLTHCWHHLGKTKCWAQTLLPKEVACSAGHTHGKPAAPGSQGRKTDSPVETARSRRHPQSRQRSRDSPVETALSSRHAALRDNPVEICPVETLQLETISVETMQSSQSLTRQSALDYPSMQLFIYPCIQTLNPRSSTYRLRSPDFPLRRWKQRGLLQILSRICNISTTKNASFVLVRCI